jgi:TolA-binding protein
VELQRDVAALQDQVRSLERSNSENMGRITGLLQQSIDSINKVSTSIALLDAAVRERDKSVAAPVATLGAKVDQMSTDFQAVRVSIDDLSSRLGKLQQNLVDLNQTIKVIQAPPSAPPPSGGGPGSASMGGTPSGSAETLYSNAMRDKNGGNDDLALQGFNEYLRFYGNTEMAPNAQYYIGEVFYNRKDYDNALKAFDLVLERYPENNKTLDATYMKGRTLVQMGERTKGADEFRTVYNKSPRSDLGIKAKAQLASMGLSLTSPASKRAPARKKR